MAVCVASLRRVHWLTAAALFAGVLAGCKTTSSVDTTGSIAPSPATRSEAEWRGEAQALGDKFRADPRNPDAAIRYARALRATGQRDASRRSAGNRDAA